jgi:hypothetical protein
MCGACSADGEEERCIQVLMRKPEGKGPFEKPRHRWVNNIKMDLQDVGWGLWTRLILLRIGTVVGLL